MAEFKGTKGKWKSREDYDEEYGQPVMSIDVGDSIESLVTVWSGQDKDDKEIKEQVMADALLISKAPELLEMLNSVLELQKTNYGNGMNTHLALISKAKEIEVLIKESTEL